MTGDVTYRAVAVALGVLCALGLSLPANAVGRASTVAPSETTPATSEPAVPETTEPIDTEVTTPDDTLVGAGESDGEIDTPLTAIAVVGFVLLLALASWWMVRRSDPDAGPMPPPGGPPSSDLI